MILPFIGALIGARFLGFWGGLAGFIGVLYLRRKIREGAFNPGLRQRREEAFISTVFSLMGALAKVDGRVSEQDISYAEKVISRLGLSEVHRAQAIEHFRRGAKPDFNVDAQLAEFNSACAQAPNLRNMLIMYLIGTAMTDGKISPNELALLKRVGASLGLNVAMIEMLLAQAQGTFGFGAGSSGRAGWGGDSQPGVNALQEAYTVLGIAQSDTDAQVKRAYRKLMSDNHPDKLMGQGLPDDMIEMATERSKAIQAAYDLIKKSRGLP